MKALLTAKVGMFLVVSSVLAVWTLLAAQHVQAQIMTEKLAPACPTSRNISSINDADNTDAIDGLYQGEVTVDAVAPGDIDFSDGFTEDFDQATLAASEKHYFKIEIPPLTSGELSVSMQMQDDPPGTLTGTVASLCRGTSRVAYDAAVKGETMPHDFNIPVEPISPGDYYLVVEGLTSTDTGVYTVQVDFTGIMPADPTTLNREGKGVVDSPFGETAYMIATSAENGLLTVYTTGSTDVEGQLLGGSPVEGSPAIAVEDKGQGDNFRIVAPVEKHPATYTVIVRGQGRDERGDYSLVVEFKSATDVTYPGSSPDNSIEERRDADYFFIKVPTTPSPIYGFMTVDTTGNTNTKGTLFGMNGEIASDSDTGADSNFRMRVPVSPGNYVVKVEGQSSTTTTPTGEMYTVNVFADPADNTEIPSSTSCAANCNIVAAAQGSPLNTYDFFLNITTAGTLQVKTTGSTDTIGTLYGMDGQQIAWDDDSGDNTNFMITEYVEAGQYIVTVEGQTRDTVGTYELVVNFVEGASIAGPVGPVDPMVCEDPEPLRTDARGNLGNPPDGGFRSGVGLISGWVCAANEVEVVITSNDRQGSPQETLNVAYGTSRADTVGRCRHSSPNTGFGMTYNFNHLREGEYTIQALADDEEIGEPQTFNVVHLTTFAIGDDDRFLREESLRGTECRVNDFPALGEDTILEWEESTQNFTIIDAG